MPVCLSMVRRLYFFSKEAANAALSSSRERWNGARVSSAAFSAARYASIWSPGISTLPVYTSGIVLTSIAQRHVSLRRRRGGGPCGHSASCRVPQRVMRRQRRAAGVKIAVFMGWGWAARP